MEHPPFLFQDRSSPQRHAHRFGTPPRPAEAVSRHAVRAVASALGDPAIHLIVHLGQRRSELCNRLRILTLFLKSNPDPGPGRQTGCARLRAGECACGTLHSTVAPAPAVRGRAHAWRCGHGSSTLSRALRQPLIQATVTDSNAMTDLAQDTIFGLRSRTPGRRQRLVAACRPRGLVGEGAPDAKQEAENVADERVGSVCKVWRRQLL